MDTRILQFCCHNRVNLTTAEMVFLVANRVKFMKLKLQILGKFNTNFTFSKTQGVVCLAVGEDGRSE